jgi:hypothetical protein
MIPNLVKLSNCPNCESNTVKSSLRTVSLTVTGDGYKINFQKVVIL